MIKREIIGEYLKTMAITLLCVLLALLLLLAFVQYDVYEEQKKISAENEQIEYYLIGVLIQKNKYLETQNPDNYKINLRLGILYELDKKFKDAEVEFQKSISKAPYEEFKPQYKLANLYLRMSEYDKAENLMNSISERPNNKLIEYKGEIFYKLGDKYYNQGDYQNAIIRYEKSLSYFKAIKSSKIRLVENSIASAYVYLADNYVSEMQISDAINALEIANSIVKAPILKYKLAILLQQENPMQAYKYFEEVYKKEPALINYEEYSNFLYTLVDAAVAKGDIAEAELYRYKAKKVKEYYENNVLSIQDIAILEPKGEFFISKFFKKCHMNVEFRLKNNSDEEIKSLFITIGFKKDNQKIEEYYQQVIQPEIPLKPHSIGPLVNLNTIHKFAPKEDIPKQITAEITASKSENSYKLNLADINLTEIKKKKSNLIKLEVIRHKFDKFIESLKEFVHLRK